jgi:hypothetical protein
MVDGAGIGHQGVYMALGLGGQRQVDALGQLVEGQPAGHEVVSQLSHGRVAFGVADPQVVVVAAGPGHTPSRH